MEHVVVIVKFKEYMHIQNENWKMKSVSNFTKTHVSLINQKHDSRNWLKCIV